MKKKSEDDDGVSKLLLIGRASCGKTSMKCTIFQNTLPHETQYLKTTTSTDISTHTLLSSLKLSIIDSVGQRYSEFNQYIEENSDRIYSNVAVLLFIIDISLGWDEILQDLLIFQKKHYQWILSNSPKCKIFTFIHKIDLVKSENLLYDLSEKIQNFMIDVIKKRNVLRLYATSIFDNSLYESFSEIIKTLIPNIKKVKKQIMKFKKITGALEVVLFEKSTFLIITRSCLVDKDGDVDESLDFPVREKTKRMSKVIKTFYLNFKKRKKFSNSSKIESIMIQNMNFKAFVNQLTNCSWIMVVVGKDDVEMIEDETVRHNIGVAKKYFRKLL